LAVQHAHEILNLPLYAALGLPSGIDIDWRSPLSADGFKEYRDEEALRQLGVSLNVLSLRDFWPARGPVWDGLARTSAGDVILLEAKAHIAELASPPTKAGQDSLKKIAAAFQMVRAEIAPRSSSSWTSTFYQYANRLAFLYLLRKNGVPAHLVHVMFLNATDVEGPRTIAEWQGALELLRSALGLRNHSLKPFVHELYIDSSELLIHAARPQGGLT